MAYHGTVTADGPLHRFLSADHARLDALLRQAVAPGGGVDMEVYRGFRGGILRHIGMEERVLMPASKEDRGGEPLPVAARLRVDHHAISLLVIPTPTPGILATLAGILVPHNILEEKEGGFYRECERLAGDGVDALYARMMAVPELPLAAHVDTAEIMAYLARTLDERRRFLASRDA